MAPLPVRPLELLLTIVNLALLFGLFIIFLKQYRETRAKFTLGLLAFAGVLVVKELLTVIRFLGRAADVPLVGPRLELLATLAQAIALAALLWQVAK